MRFRLNNLYLGLGSSLFILLLSILGFWEGFEAQTLDYRFILRGKQAVIPQIKIIEINDEDIAQFGRWPWPRSYFAGFMRILSEYQPRAVVFDILFSEEDIEHPEYDELLAGETERLAKVYYASYFSIDHEPQRISYLNQKIDDQIQKRLEEFSLKAVKDETEKFLNAKDVTIPIAKLLDITKGIGFTNMPAERDGKVRKVPLVIRYKGKNYPALSLAVVCGYLDCKLSNIEIKNKFIVIKKNNRVIKIPIDKYGNMLINYPGNFNLFKRSSFFTIANLYDQIKNSQIKDEGQLTDLKDEILLIGLVATGTADLRPTPFSNTYPGVGIHASIINNILQEKFISKAEWYVTTIILIALGLIIAIFIPKRKPIITMGILLGVSLSYVSLALILFIFGNVWIDLIGPLSCILLSYTLVMFNEFTAERYQKGLIENELKIASHIQQSFLPKILPVKNGIQIAATSLSAKHVGGDLYDFIDLDSQCLGIMIGDVSGKGVPASLYMARAVGELRSRAHLYNQPSKILTDLNNILAKQGLSDMFVTLLYIIIDLSKNRFIFSNGGHNAILYKASDTNKFRILDTKDGTPLGIIEDIIFSDEVVNFQKGDMVVLYTDGLIEARNKSRLEFGQENLKKFIIDNKYLEPQRLAEATIERVRIFSRGVPQHDDMTLIVVKFL